MVLSEMPNGKEKIAREAVGNQLHKLRVRLPFYFATSLHNELMIRELLIKRYRKFVRLDVGNYLTDCKLAQQ